MSDFFQNGLVTTLHDLGSADPALLEAELVRATAVRPIGLVLPVTASDMRAAPFRTIVDTLVGAEFLDEIVVALNRAPSWDDYDECAELLTPLGERARLLWCDGSRIQQIYADLDAAGVHAGGPGKGRSVWTAFGYLQANADLHAYASHDCDITTYDRALLVRLCLPVAHPHFEFDYAKAYYARYSGEFHGRVARLLVTPLVRALQLCLGPDRFLQYLDSFRYPLSGEFSISADLAAVNRVPSDWGLEVGTLAEVYRNTSLKRVCQVDICSRYDHKHQPSNPSGSAGLGQMAADIVTSLLRTLAAMGTTLQREQVATLQAAYLRLAQDAIHQYAADAAMNLLHLDRHAEEHLAESFATIIGETGHHLDPRHAPVKELPNWARVRSAVPDVSLQLREAVESDRQEATARRTAFAQVGASTAL